MSIFLHITYEILHGIAEKHYKAIEAKEQQTEFERREAARRQIHQLIEVDIPLTKKQKVLYPDLCVQVARSLHREDMVADIIKAEEGRERWRRVANIFRFTGNVLYLLFCLAVVVGLIGVVVWGIYHLIVDSH